MSKKYIFIKFLEPAPCDFLLDENALFDAAACQTVVNILQLNQEQELRFVIAKDPELQSALTSALPQEGNHGLVWSGVKWPAASPFLMFDERIHSIFVFYKTGEFPPEILDRPRAAIARKWELYNWHIYQLPGFQLLKNNVFIIRALSRHELEADKQFAALWRAFKDGQAFPWQAADITLNGRNNNKNGSAFYRPLIGLQHSSRAHLSSLFKFVLPNLEGTLYLASPHNFDYFWPALFLPVNLKLWPNNTLQKAYFKTTKLMLRFPAQELSRTISLFISDLRRLLLASPVSQTDLFYGNLEGEFVEYWQREKKQLEERAANLLDFNEQKALVAARFLINSEAFINEVSQLAFLRLALAQTVSALLKRKNKPEFVQLLHQTLREFYLDFYAYRQIAAFIKDEAKQIKEEPLPGQRTSLDGAIAEFNFTADSRKNRQRRLVEILLDDETDSERSFIPQDVNIPVTEAVADTKTAERLGQYGVSILVHHLSKKEERQAGLLLRWWLEVYYFLQQTAPNLRSGGRMALALDTGFKARENNEWRRVIESFLQNGLKNSQLKLLDVSLDDGSRSKAFLFFEKTAKEI